MEIQNKSVSIEIFCLIIPLKDIRSTRTKNSAKTSNYISRVSQQSIVPCGREAKQSNCARVSHGLSQRGIHRQMQTGSSHLNLCHYRAVLPGRERWFFVCTLGKTRLWFSCSISNATSQCRQSLSTSIKNTSEMCCCQRGRRKMQNAKATSQTDKMMQLIDNGLLQGHRVSVDQIRFASISIISRKERLLSVYLLL